MRTIALTRSELTRSEVRFDPAFYLGRAYIQKTEGEWSRSVRLSEIVEFISDGARLPVVGEAGVPMLRLTDVQSCELEWSAAVRVDGTAGSWTHVQPGDVLFTRAAQPFRAAAVPDGVPRELAISSELTVIRPRAAVLPEYLAAILCTPTLSKVLRDLASRGTLSALPRLRLADVGHLPIPLPPRSLQESIGNQYQRAVELTRQASAEISSVVAALHTEIDHRVSVVKPAGDVDVVRRDSLPARWDVPFLRARAFRAALSTSPHTRRLLDLSCFVSPSLRGLSDDESVLAIRASDVNETTFLVEGAKLCTLSSLSSRMRQRVQIGDVLICTTGDGDQVAFVDEQSGQGDHPIIASATLTALRFSETPRVFAATLRHPLVQSQLRLLATGSIQRFVKKSDLDDLLVPVLGQVWREDFETRLVRAMERRREALLARVALIESADDFLRNAVAHAELLSKEDV